MPKRAETNRESGCEFFLCKSGLATYRFNVYWGWRVNFDPYDTPLLLVRDGLL